MRRLLATVTRFCIATGLIGFTVSAVAQGPATHLIVTQTVRPTAPIQFDARVIFPTVQGPRAVANAQVTLRGGQGQVHQGMTDYRGNVTIKGVSPGLYAMTAQADGLFACYAMHVLGPQQAEDRTFPGAVEIACALVRYRDFESTIMPYLVTQVDRAELVTDLDLVPANEMYRVTRSNGGLVGSLSAVTNHGAKQMNVFLVKNRRLISRAISDDEGRFSFADVESGIYSLLAVGPDGLAAIGFELVDRIDRSGSAGLSSSNGQTLVNQIVDDGAGSLDIDVVPLTSDELELLDRPAPDENKETGEDDEAADEVSYEIVSDDSVMVDEFGNPVGNCGPCGGDLGSGSGGGGGGSGGGGGGSGGGAGLAALAGIAAVAAANSNNNNGINVASPAFPAN